MTTLETDSGGCRVLVCGGRNYTDREFLFQELDRLHFIYQFAALAHGGALGADKLAGEWARDRDIRVMVYHANWKKFGTGAGPVRNRWMHDNFKPHLCVAFPGGKGTRDMVDYATLKGTETTQLWP